jgi:hypothetical protein
MSTALRGFVALFALSLGLAAAGCGGNSTEDNCAIFCEKNVTCQPDATDQATCMSICQKQAESESYAEAIDEQADCYEKSSCQDIANGVCDPQDL